jgi:tryptophanyl-tRNA synthetase
LLYFCYYCDMSKKILLSGIQPSGTMHIGNYFGAMKQFVDMQDECESYICIVDLHALTTVQDKKTLEENTLNVLLDYLAVGLDPQKVTLFKQSDVPEVTELAWIFNCITTMPYLERAVAYKDAGMKAKEVNVGLFDYPILMSADILIQDADVVPVGADQKQHIEYARDTAEKFNRVWGETFKIPEPLILSTVAVVPGTDGRKMSKSYGNTIPLFATRDEIQKAVMSIVTDSGGDIPKNVYDTHKLFRAESDLAPLYSEKMGKYKDLKEALIEDIENFIRPMREKREALAKDIPAVLEILRHGGEKARVRTSQKMNDVRSKIGLKLY